MNWLCWVPSLCKPSAVPLLGVINIFFQMWVLFFLSHHAAHCFASVIGDPTGIHVHAVFVSKMAGETLKRFAQGEEGECCIGSSMNETAGTVLVISFVSLVVIVSVLAAFLFARNCILLRQVAQRRPSSMNKEAVEVFPCLTFSTSFLNSKCTAETCAICLEDYKDGERLRVLPCNHGKFVYIMLVIVKKKLSYIYDAVLFVICWVWTTKHMNEKFRKTKNGTRE